MKKVFVLFVALAMGVAMSYAQEVQTQSPSNSDYAELVATDVDLSASPMEIKDASFPSEQEIQALAEEYVQNPDQTTAALLNILLGDFGVGHFYTGQTLRGVLDLVFCWTGIPAIIGIVEGIIWLCDDEATWAARVAKWQSK